MRQSLAAVPITAMALPGAPEKLWRREARPAEIEVEESPHDGSYSSRCAGEPISQPGWRSVRMRRGGR